MPNLFLPLSGDVTQAINPWTNFLNAYGNQFSLVSVNLGRSSAPEIERDILNDVGSYGRQLGRILDAVAVLIDHVPADAKLSDKERRALVLLGAMKDEIDAIKHRHGR